jgi:hypothetical protein
MNVMGIKKSPEGVRRFKQLRAVFRSLNGGVSITQACKAAGITCVTFWRWRQANSRLETLVNKTIDSRIQMVEDAQFVLAMKGNCTAQIFFLCNRAPLKWHNVSDIKNIIYMQQNAKKDEDSGDRFKTAPRIIFTDCSPEKEQEEKNE